LSSRGKRARSLYPISINVIVPVKGWKPGLGDSVAEAIFSMIF
jgi:hypothetical protein